MKIRNYDRWAEREAPVLEDLPGFIVFGTVTRLNGDRQYHWYDKAKHIVWTGNFDWRRNYVVLIPREMELVIMNRHVVEHDYDLYNEVYNAGLIDDDGMPIM